MVGTLRCTVVLRCDMFSLAFQFQGAANVDAVARSIQASAAAMQ